METSLLRLSRLLGLAVALGLMLPFSALAQGDLAPVNLGAAGNYVILAKTAISTVPASAITGDLGLSPAATSYITGFSLIDATGYATSSQVTGRVYAADMAAPTPAKLTAAVSNMETAFTDAAGRPDPDFNELYSGNVGGQVLLPGLYKWSGTVIAPTSFTISGGPNDVWIFQIAGDLSVGSNVNVTLSGGAEARNIFWQISGEATVGTNAHFEGVILSQTAITLMEGVSLNGRALAQTAVTLDRNAITAPRSAVEISVAPSSPPVVIPPQGGSFPFTVTLTNQTSQPQTFQAWTEVMGPVNRNPVLGPKTVRLPAGATFTRTLMQQIPAEAPPGTYTYIANVGTFPGVILASDSYTFTKEAAAGAATSRDGTTADWRVTGWDGAASASATGLPSGFALSEVHPNPFRGQTQLTLEVTEAQTVRIEVLDALGRSVAVIHDGDLGVGAHTLVLDASSLPAGVYVVRAVGERFTAARSVSLLR